MKKFFHLPEDMSQQARSALLIAILITVVHFIAAIYYLYLGLSTDTAQFTTLAIVSFLLGILFAIGAGLSWRGQYTAGMILVLVVLAVSYPVISAFLVSGLGVVLGIALAVVGPVSAYQSLSPKSARIMTALTLVSGLGTILLDIFGSTARPALPTGVIHLLATSVVGVLIFLAIRQSRGSSLRLTRKLLIPTLIFFSVIIAGVVTYNTVVSFQQFEIDEEKRLESLGDKFYERLKAKEDLAVALATDVANNPEVQAAFAAKDRERLIELTLPSYQALDKQFDVPQFQFHLPPATSFLRLHNLEKYDDDLSSFRFTVLAANAEKRTVGGVELGRAGLGVRGVVPVSYRSRHIGTVEFGTDVGSTLIEELKNESGLDFQILLSRAPAEVATFEGATGESQGPIDDLLIQASTLDTPFFGTGTNYQQVLAGETNVEHLEFDDIEYAVYSMPLVDFSGNVIGVVDIIADHTEIVQQQNAQVILSVVVLLIVLLVGGFGFVYLAGQTLRPIGELTSVASTIAAGDFSKKTNIKSNDELGTLAKSFDSMTEQLQELFLNLEQRVAARTRDLEIVAEVGTATATIQENKRLLQEVVELTKERFNLYHSHIYLLDEEARLLVLAAGAGEPGRVMVKEGRSIPLDREQSLVARAARERKGVTVNDVTQEPDHLPNPLLPDTRSELAVPMIAGGNVIGVFDIQSDQVGRFTESDVNIQTTLAAQLAVSIQNVRSFERSKREAELQSLVNVIGSRIQRTTSIEETLQTAIRELGTAIGASRVKANIQSASKAASTEPTSAD